MLRRRRPVRTLRSPRAKLRALQRLAHTSSCFPRRLKKRPRILRTRPVKCYRITPAMIALIQRVSEAQVRIDGETVGAIERGILALIGVRPMDNDAAVERLLERLLSYRIFPDA